MINIIGTIYDNSSLHTVALANQVKDEEYGDGTKKQSQINQEFDTRIKEIAASQKNNKGMYQSVQSLQEKQPNPTEGDWATVVEGDDLIIYVCQTTGQWTRTGQKYKQELPDLSDYVDNDSLSSTLQSYALKSDLNSKQNTLVSGTNIKTINNQSILGYGNIEIEQQKTYYPASSSNDGLMSKSNYTDLYNIIDTTIPNIYNNIDDLSERLDIIYNTLDDDQGSNVEYILEEYNKIKEFIEGLNPDDDRLLQIINNIAAIDQKIESEKLRAQNEERQLKTSIVNLKDRVSAIEQEDPRGGDGIKHIILTLEEYQALSSYQDNTIYLIIEPNKTWTFGGTFPIVFTDGLGTFPITLT